MSGRTAGIAATAAVAAALAWILLVGLPRWYGPARSRAAAVPEPPAAAAVAPTTGRHIKARLFYVADDGARLTSVERDVPYGSTTVEQAKRLIEAQIAPVAEPLVSAIPTGTKLRALFVTDRGEAYVDLGREIDAAHPGGTTAELLTTYTIVDALTVNLPAITAVQLLVDGKAVETLAGHVDERRPLPKNLIWTE